MKKKLIMLTNHFPFSKGEEFIETEMQYLSDKFERVLVISSSNKDNLTRQTPDNVQIQRFKKSRLNFLPIKFYKVLFKELVNLYQEKKLLEPKIIKYLIIYILNSLFKYSDIKKILYSQNINIENTIIYSYWANENLFLALLLKEQYPGVKIKTRVHGYDLYLERYKDKYIPFRNFIFSEIDCIYTISEHGYNYLQKTYPLLPSSKMVISRLGINNKNIKSNFEISRKDELTLVSCSNMNPVKRIRLLIQELAIIKDIKIKWIHIGTGIQWDELSTFAKNTLLPNENIIFKFLGHKKNKEIYEFYQQNEIDLFVSVSDSEGIPVTFMEAQSFGIPIISTNVGGVPEIVNNKNGYLIDKNFIKGTLKSCLDNYIEKSEEDILQMKKESFKTWQSHYNAETNYNEFAIILGRD